jgi:hypothetical protein
MKTSRLAQNLQTGMLFLALVVSQFAGQPTESSSGKESQQMITAGNSQIFFNVEDGPLSVSKADLASYVRDAAKAVTAYYGTFPIHKTVINFVPSDDDGIGFGTSTYDDDEDYGVVTINIGENTTRRNLRSSWTLTHELMHLAFPVVSHHKRWLSEGIATYVEPIGRMRIGNLSPEEVWGDLLTNLPKGLPRQETVVCAQHATSTAFIGVVRFIACLLMLRSGSEQTIASDWKTPYGLSQNRAELQPRIGTPKRQCKRAIKDLESVFYSRCIQKWVSSPSVSMCRLICANLESSNQAKQSHSTTEHHLLQFAAL